MFTTNHSGRRMRLRKLRALAVTAVAGIALTGAAGASPASAASEQFMSNQGLGHGNAKASVDAHSGTYVVVYGNSDHSWCPSLGRGYAGYTSTPDSGGNTTVYQGANCGTGYQVSSWDTNGYMWHGSAWNRNVSTYDNFSYASVIW